MEKFSSAESEDDEGEKVVLEKEEPASTIIGATVEQGFKWRRNLNQSILIWT